MGMQLRGAGRFFLIATVLVASISLVQSASAQKYDVGGSEILPQTVYPLGSMNTLSLYDTKSGSKVGTGYVEYKTDGGLPTKKNKPVDVVSGKYNYVQYAGGTSVDVGTVVGGFVEKTGKDQYFVRLVMTSTFTGGKVILKFDVDRSGAAWPFGQAPLANGILNVK
ncbi:hypothetical protein FF011L_19350 [Roseimaritima multifibrata]|uniref:Uncharacterized protein n=1 Tax=Roseimaritima multifibrata TaxID=1930274 RepID=A0A517MEB0_9BACT|nr:hypothetical protein [Roseimaritima multifibrata]QDS93176.1 hypothetical protein FF011L_19350 [Roseimaritima multifibrata]